MYRLVINKDPLYRFYILALIAFLSVCATLLVLSPPEKPLGSGGVNVSFASALVEVVPMTNVSHAMKSRRSPQVIIIGTRKSGTRALLKFLEVNPRIKSASSEVHFFDRDENYEKGPEWYEQQMPETTNDELTIEKSPAYFVTREVPQRVKSMNSSIQLVVIFRDPVTRLISDYSQLIANRLEPSNRSDEVVDETSNELIWKSAKVEFERHVLRPDGSVNEQRRMVRTGMYSMHLERWLAVFPREQFHFVNGEKLISEPHLELRKLERFLGLKPVIMQEHFVFNPRKGFFCLSATNRSTTSDLSARRPTCLSKSKGRRHINVDKDLRKKLADFYAPYNEYLLELTNINLS